MKQSGQNNCWQLRIDCQQQHVDAITTLMEEWRCLALSYQDAEDQPVYQETPEQHRLWQHLILHCLFSAPLTDSQQTVLNQCVAKETIMAWDMDSVATEGWVEQYRADHSSVRIGRRLWICPSWQHPPDDPEAIIIHLDPGLAFGTGSHATTQLCLEWLVDHPCAHQTDRLLDFGCGSGILAIAAAKVGFPWVMAVDHDPQALTACTHNVKSNGVANNVKVADSEMLARDLKVGIIMANILLNPLLTLKTTFLEYLQPNGVCVLSGILAEQVPALIDHYRADFTCEATHVKNEWACCILKSKT